MNGPHDLGGMMGFGPIKPERNEPVFHAPWEGRMFALDFAFGAADNQPIDANRHRHEKIPPPRYLNSSYYQKWLGSLELRVVEPGFASEAELAAGHSVNPPIHAHGLLRGSDVANAVATRWPYTRPAGAPAKYAVGERVKTRNIHPIGHTRLPRYARAHIGTVERVNGYMVFPDSNAHGRGEDPHWCYSICFAGNELWGTDADPTLSVSLDLWEPYLEAPDAT
jgi:nitrile hydratase beta subunit